MPHALVPLKTSALAKGRLGAVLSDEERAGLAAAMAGDVLDALTGHPAITGITLCAPPPAPALANLPDVAFFAEPADANGLNAAAAAALRHLAAAGVEDVLIVHGDLPLLDAAALDAFTAAHQDGAQSAVTLCPDHHGTGTNLMALRPPGLIAPLYGTGSFARHQAAARAAKARLAIVNIPVGRFDIDEAADLMALLNRPPDGRAHRTLDYLHTSGIASRLRADGAAAP